MWGFFSPLGACRCADPSPWTPAWVCIWVWLLLWKSVLHCYSVLSCLSACLMMLFIVISPRQGTLGGVFKSHLTSSECTLLSNLTQVSHAGWGEQLCSVHCDLKPKSFWVIFSQGGLLAPPKGKRLLTLSSYEGLSSWFERCSWNLKATCIFWFFTFWGVCFWKLSS